MRGMHVIASLLGVLALAWIAPASSAPVAAEAETATAQGTVAISAGTIHLVEGGRTLENGTVLFKNGRIIAVGTDLPVPSDATVVDYGPGAVIVPGLVAAYSSYGSGSPATRTASPGLRAVDGFDPFGTYGSALSSGVTSVYITPAESRLIAGQGAVVKLAGEDLERRVVNPSAAIHGAVDSSARNAPGFWEPPIPATAETGMGYAKPQLPKSTMGAVVALGELIEAARSGDTESEYGYHAVRDLKPLLDAGTPWRMSAIEAREIRALLDFSQAHGVPLIIDKALGADGLADEIAAAGASVVFRVPYAPNTALRDLGKERDARWPKFDVPAALLSAGVRVAIAGSSPRDLLFSANLASRGGLDEGAALRAITLTPAELYGSESRIGSIAVGKDADFCVLNAAPFSGSASVLATWIEGELVWSSTKDGTATVIAVDELHLGDGTVMRPGELLMQDGRILEVGARVSRPRGATVVRGRACMPGMIDAFGHLGLEGSRKVPATDYALREIVGPGDHTDRRVAAHGITTVVLTPRGASKSGAPVMAYKPAAQDPERQVVGDPVALRLKWTDSNRLKSGASVKQLLAKAKEYRGKWTEYEAAMAVWTPPPPAPPKEEKEDKKKDDEKEDAKDEDDKKDDKKKKKKKKKKDEEEPLEPDPITGVWAAELADGDDSVTLKMRLVFEEAKGSGDVYGNLRSTAVADGLVEVAGYWDREEKQLRLRGLGSKGWVTVTAEPKKMKLEGTVSVGESSFELSAERTSKEVVVAKRQERRKKKDPPKAKAPKGKPKKPKVDAKLEPLRRAMEGRASVVIEVQRDDEILDCVAAFEQCGIRPVLYGASDAYKVIDHLVGRVAGILLSPTVLQYDAKRGTDYRTPYSDYQNAGIPVAFHSGAEEGAAGLPLAAAYAVAQGMSPTGALRALTADAAAMMSIGDRVGTLERGRDADVLLLDDAPLAPGTSILRAWVNGREVRQP